MAEIERFYTVLMAKSSLMPGRCTTRPSSGDCRETKKLWLVGV